jgi:hypothetical protein
MHDPRQMSVAGFLRYLHDHAATAGLADALAEILVLRRRAALVPAFARAPDGRPARLRAAAAGRPHA